SPCRTINCMNLSPLIAPLVLCAFLFFRFISFLIFFFFNHTAPTEIYTLSLHDALPISLSDGRGFFPEPTDGERFVRLPFCALRPAEIDEGIRRLAQAVAAATK